MRSREEIPDLTISGIAMAGRLNIAPDKLCHPQDQSLREMGTLLKAEVQLAKQGGMLGVSYGSAGRTCGEQVIHGE